MHVTTSTEADLDAKTKNLIADTKAGDPDQAVVVGAHLDSVVEGPGINDNGSGSRDDPRDRRGHDRAKDQAAPHRAVRLLGRRGERPVRFASTTSRPCPRTSSTAIYANLNFDMVGSPNYARFVYDGDGSDTPAAGPPGSGEIEGVFTRYFASVRASPRSRPSSAAAPTTARSSRSASPPAACSPAPRASRPPSRRPSTAAPPASPSTPATTRPATRSTTSTSTRSTR